MPSCRCLRLIRRAVVGVGVPVEHLAHVGRVESRPGGDVDDHVVVEDRPRLREVAPG